MKLISPHSKQIFWSIIFFLFFVLFGLYLPSKSFAWPTCYNATACGKSDNYYTNYLNNGVCDPQCGEVSSPTTSSCYTIDCVVVPTNPPSGCSETSTYCNGNNGMYSFTCDGNIIRKWTCNFGNCTAAPVTCSGNYTCSNLVCVPPAAISGVCNNATLNACTAGTPGGYSESSTYYYWYCYGINGGATSGQCSKAKTLTGVCGTAANTCNPGTPGSYSENSTTYYWYCSGLGGGGSSGQCSAAKPTTPGVCSTTANTCNPGNPGGYTENSTTYYWYCYSTNGGATSGQCSAAKTINAVCAATHYNCNPGTPQNSYDYGTYWGWYCLGLGNGTSQTDCREYKAVVPSPVSSYSTSSTTAYASWTQTVLSGGSYYFTYKKQTDGAWPAYATTGTNNFTNIYSLTPSTTYQWKVMSCNSPTNCSGDSTVSQFTTSTPSCTASFSLLSANITGPNQTITSNYIVSTSDTGTFTETGNYITSQSCSLVNGCAYANNALTVSPNSSLSFSGLTTYSQKFTISSGTIADFATKYANESLRIQPNVKNGGYGCSALMTVVIVGPTPTPSPTLAPTLTPTIAPTLTPTPCQVTTSPASQNLNIGGTATINASVTSGLGGSATINQMRFGSYQTTIATVNPASDSSSPYSTTVTAVAAGPTAVWATADLSDGRTCQSTGTTDTDITVAAPTLTPIPTITPTITPTPPPSVFSISGKIFNDANVDTKSAGDSPYTTTSVTVTMFNNGTGTNYIANSSTSNGTYSSTLVLPAGQYAVTFSGLAAGDSFTYPSSSLIVNVGSPCIYPVTSESICASGDTGNNCTSSGAGCSGSISNLNAGVTSLKNPWIQSKGADLRWDNSLSPYLGVPPSGQSVSSDGTGGMPGIVFTGKTSPFGIQPVSSKNWQVGSLSYSDIFTETHSLIPTSYRFLLETANSSGIPITNIASIDGITHGIYKVEGGLNLSGADYTFGSGNFVILVHGDLNINRRIRVPVGSTAVFSASGNITVNRALGEASTDGITTTIEGLYSADNDFVADGTNSCPTIDKRLNVAGSVIANAGRGGGSFKNYRTLCGGNTSNPSVSFIERPDFMLNYPSLVRQTIRAWQDVAP